MKNFNMDYIIRLVQQIIQKDYIVGLDIGSSAVKLTQFIKKEDGLSLVRIDWRQTGGTDEGIILALKDVIKGSNINRCKVIAVINCPKTAVKIIRAPYMPKQELRAAIKLEAANYFPFPLEDTFLDYEILEEFIDKGVRKYEILTAVSPKETINRYLTLLRKAGITAAALVPSCCALQKLVERCYAEGENKVSCFIDIGARNTELIICRGKNLQFSRKIPLSGEDFSKAMTGMLVSDRGKTELAITEAEKIKKEVGIPAEGEAKLIDNKISTTQILALLRAPLEQFTSEIERCFDYYREEKHGEKVDSIVLLGGGASLFGLNVFLSRSLSLPVEIGNPLEKVKKISDSVVDDKYNISHYFGAALGAGLSQARGINLMPPEIKESGARTFKRTVWETAAVSVSLVLIFIYTGMRIQLGNFYKRVLVSSQEYSSLAPQLAKVKEHSLAVEILADEPFWDDIFMEISGIIPAKVYLTDLAMREGSVIMKGKILGQDVMPLSNFILALEKGLFANIKLVKTKNLEEKKEIEFELNCSVEQ